MLAAMALALTAGAAHAQGPGQTRAIAVEWLAEEVPRPGATVMTALRFVPSGPEWHGYWSNPGDAGLGLTAAWRLPAGWRAAAPLYPVPKPLLISGLMNHVYEGEHAVLVPLTVPAGASLSGTLPSGRLDYLACTDQICVPQTAEVVLRAPSSGRDMRFDRWRAAIAPTLSTPGRFALADGALRVAVPLAEGQALARPHLFVANEQLVEPAAPQRFFRQGNILVAEVALAIDAAPPPQVEAILSFDTGRTDGLRLVAGPGPVPNGLPPLAPSLDAVRLALLAGGALLGGLLLNLMPCVFPILSLKALALARSGDGAGAARREALAYSAGAVLACVALGALLLTLRAGGEQVGWAFQLQEPAVVVALLLLALAATANFLGLFELPALGGRAGDGRGGGAFATGLLAAFVATPCTGPFMAAALGAALLLPAGAALLLFAMLGLGLALPFILIGFVPALRDRLPRPGPWLARFRRWMALPMGLTAAALMWLAWRLGGASYATGVAVTGALLLALLALLGRQQRGGNAGSPAALIAGWGAVAGAVAAVALFASPPERGVAQGANVLAARPFSDAALAAARAGRTPVFVWFTADWCVTCKVNEQVAIEREATRAAFEGAGVTVLRGDWTRRDPAIARFLSSQGAAGVPLYLWYEPGAAAPEQLPQLLTPDLLPALANRSAPARR